MKFYLTFLSLIKLGKTIENLSSLNQLNRLQKFHDFMKGVILLLIVVKFLGFVLKICSFFGFFYLLAVISEKIAKNFPSYRHLSCITLLFNIPMEKWGWFNFWSVYAFFFFFAVCEKSLNFQCFLGNFRKFLLKFCKFLAWKFFCMKFFAWNLSTNHFACNEWNL